MSYVSKDPNTLVQKMLKQHYGFTYVDAPQHQGSHYATVIDTDLTNPSVSKGNMRLTIPSLGPNNVWKEIPYIGEVAPPNNTTVVVGFDHESRRPVHHGYIGFHPCQTRFGAGAPSSNLGHVGDVYINISNAMIYKKTAKGWDSGSQIVFPDPDPYRPI